jgi:protein-S-isoprenylcysteine O-methyltransferase Ste14
MPDNFILLRKVLVVASALLYWGSVVVNMYQLKRYIGKFPNIKPRGLKERILWLGWVLVVAGWIGQPFIMETHEDAGPFYLFTFFLQPLFIIGAVIMLIGGYLGTRWCYEVLGDSWRIWIDKREKIMLVKDGPYRIVRHPIYVFQIIVLLSTFFLLPTPFSLALLFILIFSVLVKTSDEEKYLMNLYADEYRDYSLRTGRFIPKWKLL